MFLWCSLHHGFKKAREFCIPALITNILRTRERMSLNLTPAMRWADPVLFPCGSVEIDGRLSRWLQSRVLRKKWRHDIERCRLTELAH